MKETSKAMRRRWCEHALGTFAWRDLFVGPGIDVGCGDDPIATADTVWFDQAQGDASRLRDYFQPGQFAWLHSSQCLEHLPDPHAAMRGWLEVVRPGGWVVVTVPSWELYERMIWPSRFNADHRSTWSMFLKGSPAPVHVYVPDYLESFRDVAQVVLQRQLDCHYDYQLPPTVDQTWHEEDGVEPFIEFVLRKK